MKDVIALREQSESLFVFEFVQTNGALESAFADFEAFDVGVDEGREGGDRRRVQASGGSPGASPAGGGLSSGGGEAAVSGALADVDREESHEYERRDEDDDCYGHGRFEVGVREAIRSVRRLRCCDPDEREN
ncbi:hypothetical protein Sjap_018828 [Stephania japonica]|uniref:Uncharacterized protein n=1 Tax=Stephania japonica TaxID=461633 RepID=A0AAP0NKZ4_9MAGN